MKRIRSSGLVCSALWMLLVAAFRFNRTFNPRAFVLAVALAFCATHAASATCVRSSSTAWSNAAFLAQTAPFTATFD